MSKLDIDVEQVALEKKNEDNVCLLTLPLATFTPYG
jgi:hypothetical protein